MFTRGKMEECMKGGMSEEKMKMMVKMMEQFSAKVMTEGEGKEETCGEKKSEKTECCPDAEKVFDLCSQKIRRNQQQVTMRNQRIQVAARI
jgi:hypothetical protein